jgi:hypothetical protein
MSQLSFLKDNLYVPTFAKELDNKQNLIQSKIKLYDVFVLTADDYHWFKEYEETLKNLLMCEIHCVEKRSIESDGRDYYQLICSVVPLKEDVYAKLILDLNKIKTESDFDYFVSKANWSDYNWDRVVRKTPKTQKSIYKTDEEFLDKNKNQIWKSLLNGLSIRGKLKK